jgi:hypothetical protein
MAWSWHDRFGQYPHREKPDGNYTGLVSDPREARVWDTEESAAASALRANKAGIAEIIVVELEWI